MPRCCDVCRCAFWCNFLRAKCCCCCDSSATLCCSRFWSVLCECLWCVCHGLCLITALPRALLRLLRWLICCVLWIALLGALIYGLLLLARTFCGTFIRAVNFAFNTSAPLTASHLVQLWNSVAPHVTAHMAIGMDTALDLYAELVEVVGEHELDVALASLFDNQWNIMQLLSGALVRAVTADPALLQQYAEQAPQVLSDALRAASTTHATASFFAAGGAAMSAMLPLLSMSASSGATAPPPAMAAAAPPQYYDGAAADDALPGIDPEELARAAESVRAIIRQRRRDAAEEAESPAKLVGDLMLRRLGAHFAEKRNASALSPRAPVRVGQLYRYVRLTYGDGWGVMASVDFREPWETMSPYQRQRKAAGLSYMQAGALLRRSYTRLSGAPGSRTLLVGPFPPVDCIVDPTDPLCILQRFFGLPVDPGVLAPLIEPFFDFDCDCSDEGYSDGAIIDNAFLVLQTIFQFISSLGGIGAAIDDLPDFLGLDNLFLGTPGDDVTDDEYVCAVLYAGDFLLVAGLAILALVLLFAILGAIADILRCLCAMRDHELLREFGERLYAEEVGRDMDRKLAKSGHAAESCAVTAKLNARAEAESVGRNAARVTGIRTPEPITMQRTAAGEYMRHDCDDRGVSAEKLRCVIKSLTQSSDDEVQQQLGSAIDGSGVLFNMRMRAGGVAATRDMARRALDKRAPAPHGRFAAWMLHGTPLLSHPARYTDARVEHLVDVAHSSDAHHCKVDETTLDHYMEATLGRPHRVARPDLDEMRAFLGEQRLSQSHFILYGKHEASAPSCSCH